MYRQGVLLNAIILTSLAAVIAGPLVRFVPTFQPAYMLLAIALVALEAGAVHHVFRRDRMWAGELLRYLMPELLVMVALMRIAVTLSVGAALNVEIWKWIRDPLSIFDLPWLCAIAAGLAVGASTHITMQALRDLLPQPFEQAIQSDEALRLMHVVAQDRATALGSISSRFVFGGVLVFVALGLESANIARLGDVGQPISLLSATGALCYLISGFLLYSQGRLALLQARWRLDSARVSPAIGKRWSRASWLFIGGVGMAATLLPRTYGMSFLDTLRSTLGVIGYFFVLLSYILIWLFSLIAFIPALLLSLLFGQSGGTVAPPPAFQAPPPPTQPPPTPGEPNIIATSVFWLSMVMLVIYAVVTIAQRHPLLVEKVLGQGPFRRLWEWLRELWRDTSGWATLAAEAVRQRLQPRAVPSVRAPLLRLGALAPRELVRYFYRSTLQRAARVGMPRRAAQTPEEYRATLAQALPEAEPDIAALTDAFVEATYAAREIAREDAQQARGPWQRLRSRLRQTQND